SNTRGVFEIDVNTGSSFTLTGTGALTVQRQTNGTSYADVYINPVTSSVSSTSTISVGLTTATTQANLRVNIAPSIGNFKVLGPGAAANPQTVNLYSNPLVLGGTLTIITPSVLVTNSFDVSIAGDLTVTGTGTATYTGGTNTTTFNGTGAQSANLTSTSTFTNITVNNSGGGTVTLSGTAPTLSNLNILSGILDVGSLALNVNGNITNNSSQTASGGGSITFTTTTSTSHTITSSSGSFTNLIIGGAAATNNLVTVSGNMTMNGTLDFTATAAVNRYLFIGSNLLTFSNTATISNAGSTKYIKTNGVSSDLGVTKNWPVGTNSFTYSVGTRTNYTPVTLTSLVVTTAGTYNVIPVDAAHPTSSATGEQILDYYWKITKDNTLVHGATGTLVFQVPTGLIGGSGGTLIGAYLDAINLIGWTSGGVISTVATNTLLTFTNALNTVMPAVNGEFDYTYGTTTTLPNPIAPVYSRFADADMVSNPTTVGTLGIGGSWAIATSWTLASNGFGAALSSVPTNRPVVILPAARINLDILGQSAFTTQLSGLLVVTTTGHNIGSISSTGTMRTTTSTLPAGTYTTFTASAGGTIEYAAAISMNNRSTYNNLLISSTVATTATNLTVNGNLTIGAGNTLDNSSNNANISIAGNWSNSGTYTAGTGTVTFNGTAAQSITGATTFNNLIINNTFGTSPQITLSGGNDIVSSTLTMTKGNINLNSQNLTIGTAAASPGTLSHSLASTEGWMYGGNLVRYFNTTTIADGSVTGFFPMGTSADFRPFFIGVPSGDMTTGGSFTVSNNSNNITTSVSIPDATSPVTPIVLQHQGYWSISSSGVSGGTYDLIAGGTGFGTVGNLADLNLCKATSVVGTYSAATNTTSDPRLKRIGLTLTDITTTDGDKFYVGSTNSVTSPLPIELLSFTGEAKKYGVDLQWKTASEKNNDYFTISRSAMGGTFESIGSVKGNGTTNSSHTYLLTDSKPLLGKNYYQLKQTDFDGHSTNSEVIVVNVINLEPLVSVYPNPISQHQPLNIVINGLEANSETEIQILNMQGIKINSRESITDSDGTLKTSVGLANLSTGLYILKVQNIYFKFVIE
ncbi:MAG: T9SS type A sorting domain-containing protein, partial [Bacteroidetes bacterium]|nr:T9SS type A sorting domain-containing protein [Bacteroidota bacterium]